MDRSRSGTVRLEITKLVAGGDGLAFVDGKAVFVPLALPGEEVDLRIVEERADFCRADLVEVVRPHPFRITPPCPIYSKCGGCNLQHLGYRGQIEEKRRILAEAFRRIGKLEVEIPPAVESQPFGYRNRMQLHLDAEGRLGFMRRSAATVVEAPGCPIAVPPIHRWIEERAGSSRAREERGPRGASGDRFIVFGFGERVWVEGKDGLVELSISGEPLSFHIRSFFQSNLAMVERLLPEVLDGVSGTHAADLYCGVGLFSRFLALAFRHLTCVEQDPHALELARGNVPGRGHQFSALSIEDWIRSPAASTRFDCVLVDPPRSGLSSTVRGWLARMKVPTVQYISCDPVTFARDVGELVRAGYRLERLRLYDFYPQTSHMESYARLIWA
ncbi:MAG TPA: class I SAM-dependent RNA methyltransferase [Rectinemataceae bacterium]|nr:class I SAM-dependent RNA methyltransferase [Rectinemataceae bacterium]